MAKWKCEICNTEFENFEARGFNHTIYCPLCYYKKLYNQQKEVLDMIKNNNKRIIDYGFDYDGFNNVEDLKKLIDMLVDYAKQNDKLLEEIK